MLKRSFISITFLALLASACIPQVASSPADQPQELPKPSPGQGVVRVTVTGGDNNKPVENASVYFRQKVERRLRKDKKIEMNLKTNQHGVARSPEIQPGMWLIQIVVPGWKTYGQWVEVKEGNQEVAIKLEKPPKWY